MAWYNSVVKLSETERTRGLRFLFYDGLCGHAMTLLVTGAFLPGMAVALGAGNLAIGLLASLAPISQMLQIPAILLVERIRMRKLLAVSLALAARLMLLFVAAIPFVPFGEHAVLAFFVFMCVFFSLASASGCSFNSWIKDLIPGEVLGAYLARRLSAATALGAALTVGAGFGIDGLTEVLRAPDKAYGLVFATAGMIGLLGVWILSRVPEPAMAPRASGYGWIASLLEPVRDVNFRKLLAFTALWSFTITMAGAFFTVYMLRRVGLDMGTVIILAVLGQITNVYFFGLWGGIADRFSNQSVLKAVVPLYILVILLYPFTTLPERYTFTIPLLVVIHVLGGVSTAGFTLCAGNIALKLAPAGKATAYLGANAFCAGIAASVSPLIGGTIGHIFASREISIALSYRPNIALEEALVVPALNFQGLDFVFFFAAGFGLWAVQRLGRVEEEGTVSESAVREEVFASMRRTFASTSNMSGARRMAFFPYEMLRRTARRTRIDPPSPGGHSASPASAQRQQPKRKRSEDDPLSR